MKDLYPLQVAQLEKAKGELRALCAIWYRSDCPRGGTTYSEIRPIIEEFIKTLSDHCG